MEFGLLKNRRRLTSKLWILEWVSVSLIGANELRVKNGDDQNPAVL